MRSGDTVLLVQFLALLGVLLLDLLVVVELLLLETHLVALLVDGLVVVDRVALLKRADVALHGQRQQQLHRQRADDEVVHSQQVLLQLVPLLLPVRLVHDLVDDLVARREDHDGRRQLGHEGGSDQEEEDPQPR